MNQFTEQRSFTQKQGSELPRVQSAAGAERAEGQGQLQRENRLLNTERPKEGDPAGAAPRTGLDDQGLQHPPLTSH